jgi:hypothetical protein
MQLNFILYVYFENLQENLNFYFFIFSYIVENSSAIFIRKKNY